MTIVVIGLLLTAYTGSYLAVERIAMAVGLFELVFLVVAWQAKPNLGSMVAAAIAVPLPDSKYLYLAAANVGAVIMPWMVFYQQSAVVEKMLTVEDLPAARWDTAAGARVTQVLMGAVLAVTAATIGNARVGQPLDTVQQIAQAITPFVGQRAGTLLFALGMIGAALVATIVVTLTAARTLGEIFNFRHSLEYRRREAPWFYSVYTVALVLGGLLVASGVDLVRLSVLVQVMNALLLPVVLGFLFMLARRALPDPYRLSGRYCWVLGITMAVTAGFGLYAGLWGTFT